jgi:hypothetical protein
VSGTGSDNNAWFNLSGSTLTATNAATMAAGTYSVRIRTTDSATNSFEKAFSITVVDDVPPFVVSILRTTPLSQMVSTNKVIFEVTFSEAVANVSASQFAVTPVGASTVTGVVSSVSGGPQVYQVKVGVTGGTGEFRLDAPIQ